MAKQKNKTKDADAQIAQLVSKLDSNDKRLAEAGTAKNGSKLKKSYDKLKAKIEDRETRTHKLTVDFGGGAVAQISNEFINGLIRLWAEYRPTGWTAQNADLLQSAPHVILGMGVYLTELALRTPTKMPSWSREMSSQAALIFSNLGMSNLARALRTRWKEGKGKPVELEAMRAENEAMKARLAALAKP